MDQDKNGCGVSVTFHLFAQGNANLFPPHFLLCFQFFSCPTDGDISHYNLSVFWLVYLFPVKYQMLGPTELKK